MSFQEIIETFSNKIKTYVKKGKLLDCYNYEVNEITAQKLACFFETIFSERRNAFKVNASLGVVLRNRLTGEYTYYWASQNNQTLFDNPKLVKNGSDKDAVINSFQRLDLTTLVSRPNSKFVFQAVTNVTFYITDISSTPIGSGVSLPPHLRYNRGMYNLSKDYRGKKYLDQKCFFRCLALHQGNELSKIEMPTNILLREYCMRASVSNFTGICHSDLEDISKMFHIAIFVHEQSSNKETSLLYRSIFESNNPLCLNLFQNHFSYIKDMDKYSNSYRCTKCDKIFQRSYNYRRHYVSCDQHVKHIYENGIFKPRPSIFAELEEVGINVPKALRIYPDRITYDIECMLKETDTSSTARVTYSKEHVLASISVVSNVYGYDTPKCFILNEEGAQQELVFRFLDYILEISDAFFKILMNMYEPYIKVEDTRSKEKLIKYIKRVPVISFNGARYDIKVLKKYLIPALNQRTAIDWVVQKSNSYMTIVTDRLQFLDAIFYLAPGYNLDKFIKAYGGETNKSVFPYEWFKEIDQLKERTFPSYEAFYSNLKQKMLLSVDEYKDIRNHFHINNWSMREFLINYNNTDVLPFLTALTNMSMYYADRDIDVFKEGISG